MFSQESNQNTILRSLQGTQEFETHYRLRLTEGKHQIRKTAFRERHELTRKRNTVSISEIFWKTRPLSPIV